MTAVGMTCAVALLIIMLFVGQTAAVVRHGHQQSTLQQKHVHTRMTTKVSTADCFQHLKATSTNGELESNLRALLEGISAFFDPAKFSSQGWGAAKTAPSEEGSRLCCAYAAPAYTVQPCNSAAPLASADPSNEEQFEAYGLVADAARLVRDFQDAIFDQTQATSQGFKFATTIKDCPGQECGAGGEGVTTTPPSRIPPPPSSAPLNTLV